MEDRVTLTQKRWRWWHMLGMVVERGISLREASDRHAKRLKSDVAPNWPQRSFRSRDLCLFSPNQMAARETLWDLPGLADRRITKVRNCSIWKRLLSSSRAFSRLTPGNSAELLRTLTRPGIVCLGESISIGSALFAMRLRWEVTTRVGSEV